MPGTRSSSWRDDDHHVGLTIADDGVRFDTTAKTTGFGLAGMRERAEPVGGQIDVGSTPGRGSKVSVVVPTRRVRHVAG
jgi:signal transduction histidine kinase